jgi:nitric oxide reductase activation protein
MFTNCSVVREIPSDPLKKAERVHNPLTIHYDGLAHLKERQDCHPLLCMLLKLRSSADSIPSALTNLFNEIRSFFERPAESL